MKTAEQEARDLLERLRDCAQYNDPQAMSSGDLVELANLIRDARRARGNVVTFTGITKLDLPPDRLLEAAMGELEGVVIVGFQKDGSEYFASSYADGGQVVWILERSKLKLLRTADQK